MYGSTMTSRCAFALVAVVVLSVPAQAQSRPADRMAWLSGTWRGTGILLGRNAVFTMDWQPVLAGRFVRLEFTNGFSSDSGTVPVLSAIALYQPRNDGGVTGQWFDSRGLRLALEGAVTDSLLRIQWRRSQRI